MVVDPWGRVSDDLNVIREPGEARTSFTFPEINDDTRPVTCRDVASKGAAMRLRSRVKTR